MINSLNIRFCFLLLCLAACGLTAAAQNKSDYKNREFCTNNNWSNDGKVSVSELRESNAAAQSLLNVDGKRNGGIRVIGENRADVLVRACIQAWASTDDAARSLAKSIRIETGSNVRATGANDESNWAVSYEIRVPRMTSLNLTTHNGGIGISSVEGTINFQALNGGVHLSEVAGNIKGRTTNGGVHIELTGSSWKGNGLDVETTNGGVDLTMPANYAARFETRTVNGGFRSNISGLEPEKRNDDDRYYRARGVNISRDLNGGGAPVRIVTTNGGVRINAK